MAEGLVSAVLEQLVSFAGQQLRHEWSRVSGIEGKVENLTNNLKAIQAVLVDAERRQIKEESVRNWLCRLKEVSFHLDVVLDEWNTTILRSNIFSKQHSSWKICIFAQPSCLHARKQVNSVRLRRRIACEIEELNQKLANISFEKQSYTFSITQNNKVTTTEPQRPETTSYGIDIEEVFGREAERKDLIKKLLSESSKIAERGHEIIPLVGAGGIGKTTLAQLVYNDEEVAAHFDLKVWVCVSEPFDEITIARVIVEALKIRDSHSLVGFQALLDRIHKSIAGKRFLLVLDDVWAEDYRKWEQLGNSLKSGGVGSKILVTSRKENVAKMMGVEKSIIKIKHLSDEICQSIFFQIAFLDKEKCEELEEIGKEIAQKSKGLPLVAKTLGSLMRFKKYTKEEWERVLNGELWELEKIENEVFVPLLFSYYDLSPLEKRCFLFTCCFPKDHVIGRDHLIQLWLSEGYINIEKDYKRKGIECFENIAMRSLFQDFEKDKEGNIVRCKMHDIVHDFVLFLSKNEWLNVLLSSKKESASPVEEKAFHCTLVLEPGAEIPTSLYDKKFLRTLSITNLGGDGSVIRWDLLLKLTCLRTLDLHDCGFEEVPEDIEKLMHLRYLSLHDRRHSIKLPESLYNLFNLQTLKVGNCHGLPKGIHKLVNLRHLYLSHPILLPKSLGKLPCLETLNQFSVCCSNDRKDKERYMRLEDLNKLINLKGSLVIRNIGAVEDVGEADRAQIKKIEGLDALTFDFNGSFLRNGGPESTLLLEGLRPHPNLKHLAIQLYFGTRLSPSWMTSLINLKTLKLNSCLNCECLGPFGKLPSLESLIIHRLDKVKRVGLEFLGKGADSDPSKMENCSSISFPKLKHLQFSALSDWEEWESCIGHTSSTTIMPSLVSLKIEGCRKLKAPLPEFLQRTPLQTLSIRGSSNLERLCNRDMGTGELLKILTSP